MKKSIIIIISAVISLSLYAGCSSGPSCITVVPPTINLTGEKTVIERQIVGDYRELEKDAWSISSVKTTTGKSASQGQISGDPEIVKAVKIRDYLSILLIEQFYNTGDENLFDASLMLNEKVNLEEYSTIDLDVLNEEETGESFMLFYEGIFLTIDGKKNNNHHHLKIIVRNEKEVKKINKKLNRSRQILEVDEVTLGKKYYDGLYQRSHFKV